MFTFYIDMFPQELCVYILIACSSKNLCGIAQLDVRYVTVCSAEGMKVFSRVSWPDLCGWGRYSFFPEKAYSRFISFNMQWGLLF
jgi:hypothetical protein